MVVLSACAGYAPTARETALLATTGELTNTPFHPQARYQCGPAALLTVLQASGAKADMPAMVRRVYLPAEQGSLQPEMLAATRASGRIPYRIDGTLAALVTHVSAGRPVLVLQNLGVAWLPRWHYAVVVGADRQQVVLRSGTERRRVTPLGTFLRTWKRSGNWAFVVLRPDEIPAEVDRARWLEGLVALERSGDAAAAATAWRAAAARWPDSRLALFGAANSAFALGNWRAAERGYRRLLALNPGSPAAANNLAMALSRQGRYREAEQAAVEALAVARDATTRDEIHATLAEIRTARARPAQ